MELVEHLAKALARDMGVDLGGGDIGVAEHGLKRSQVGSVFQQMSGEGMPQNVRSENIGHPGARTVSRPNAFSGP